MSSQSDTGVSLKLMAELLRDVGHHLEQPSKANHRAASLKLQRVSAIASTLAATIHSPLH